MIFVCSKTFVVLRRWIQFKMAIVNRFSAFQNYQNSNVIAERPKPQNENSEPIKSE